MVKKISLYCVLLVLLVFSCTTDQNLTSDGINDHIAQLQETSRQQTLDSTLFYLKKAATLIQSEPAVSDSLSIENDYLIGNYYSKSGNLDSASVYYYKAISPIKDSLKSKRELFYFYDAWRSHHQLQEYGECIAISKKIESLLKADDYSNRTKVYYQYIQTYLATRKYEEATKYADLRIDIFKKINNEELLTRAIITRTEIQYLFLKDKAGAYQTLDAILQDEENLSHEQKRHVYSAYGYYLHLDQQYSRAKEYYLKGLQELTYFERTPFYIPEYAKTYTNLGEVYLDLKVYDSAKIYLDKAVYEDNLSSSENIRNGILSYKLRYVYETKSSYTEIQKYLDTIIKYQNERYEEKYTKELKSLASSFKEREQLQVLKQQAEIDTIKTQIQLLLLFIISVLLIGFGIYFYKKRQRSFDKMSLQMQQRLLRSQMSPHFTFNTLYAIQNKIKQDQQGAIDYLLKFSRLLRLILENSTHNYVLLEKELESLRKYMDLQLVRFPSKFDYNIHLENLEEDDFIFIPPMLIQPFIENSIEHGFQGIDYKGTITITLTEKEGFLECRIEDNGIGIDSSKKISKEKESVSTTLIANFIEKATKRKITNVNKKDLEVTTSGVITTFLIPYKLTEHD